MRFLFVLLAFAIPALSFASVVPQWNKASGLSFYGDSYYTSDPTDPRLLFALPSAVTVSAYSPDFVFGSCGSSACFFAPDDAVNGGAYSASDYYLGFRRATVDPSLSNATTFSDWFSAGGYIAGDGSLVVAEKVYNSSAFCNYVTNTCNTTVYVAVYLKPKATDTDPTTFIPMGYWKLRLDSGSFGSSPVYVIDTDTQPNIFPALLTAGSPDAVAYNLKEAIHANAVDPDCDFSELFETAFWSECVARSIFNWLFIPSDSAIDSLVAISANPNFGTTWSYVALAPIFTSSLVQACPMVNPSSCDIGASYLSLPVLDVNGDVSIFEVVPDVVVPEYFDAFLASIVQVLIVVSISYILIYKFL